jgi:hypothetical protein
MISLRSTYLSCALLALSAVPAFCTPVVFADRTSWLNAVAAAQTVTFENAVANYSTATGYTSALPLLDNPFFLGMTVVNGTSGYSLQILDPNLSQYYNFGSGASLWWGAFNSFTTSSLLRVTFPSPVVAFAVDLMTNGGSNVSYTAKLNNNSTLVYTTSPTPSWPNHIFFGLTSDTPINTIDFYLPSSSIGINPLIDNFSYSTSLAANTSSPSDTPELCTFLLIASGLIGMALFGRRYHHPVPQAS